MMDMALIIWFLTVLDLYPSAMNALCIMHSPLRIERLPRRDKQKRSNETGRYIGVPAEKMLWWEQYGFSQTLRLCSNHDL